MGGVVERAERAAGPLAVSAPPPGFRARTVEAPGGALTLFESDDVERDLATAIACGSHAPYGRVLWPSAIACARVLGTMKPCRVLELGCGTGLVSLVAARAGHDVLATDVDDAALAAVRSAAQLARVRLRTATFDVRGAEPLPVGIDVVVAADLMYEEVLAAALARRVIAALAAGACAVLGDPGRVFRARFDALVRDGASLPRGAPVWRADGAVVVTMLGRGH